MLVHPWNSAWRVSLGIAVAVAFVAGALQPGVVEAQGTAAKPPTSVKPAQPPAKPASPPGAPVAQRPAPAPAAQAAPAGNVTMASLAGTWDGVAETPNGNMTVHMVLAYQDGKMTGSMDTQMGTLAITGATLTGDVFELGFDLQGAPGGLSGKVVGDKYAGSWSVGAETGPFAVARVPAAGAIPAAPAPAGAPAVAVGDPISGEWNGEANVGGQVMPFTLTVKLSGGTVTGEIESAMGKVPLTSGAWKDGSLLITFTYTDGAAVAMSGQIADGKLTGSLDHNKGETQGTWTAVKKKA